VHILCVTLLSHTTFAETVEGNPHDLRFEVWGADQSNTATNQTGAGLKGGFIWIYDSDSINEQLRTNIEAKPLGCLPNQTVGPCNTLDIFPGTLKENSKNGFETGMLLEDLEGFGRFHGMLKDPQEQYVTGNWFAPNGGFVGIIDADTKEAVALFRVTKTNYVNGEGKRSVHMSFWNSDGTSILVTNLHGKTMERIDVIRQDTGKIITATMDLGASIGLGRNMTIAAEATFFTGINGHGNALVSSIYGNYNIGSGFGDLTPTNHCKENGCESGLGNGNAGGRANNLPICPITTSSKNAYVTLAGGGMLVLDIEESPMKIVGEYGRNVVSGAGCGGVEVDNDVYLVGGVSAGGPGWNQSTFSVSSFDNTLEYSGEKENFPMPIRAYHAFDNTRTIGNAEGRELANTSGQIPGISTRRDSHGIDFINKRRKYIHVADRIQNKIESIDADTYESITYDLVSRDGKSGREGASGVCFTKSVFDSDGFVLNDPAPDLMAKTPDEKYLMIAFRGPVPVSVSHSAQGSCPGIGIVKVKSNGKTGKLVDILRSTNEIDNHVPGEIKGGFQYTGVERSDVHGVMVITKH